ncbi:hypothetical protein BDF21DRAFT_488740 [Thamnidium elegans]|nr:hypothetical protein BDF21DRAFT_488737 [Thamnidium elegans]KAI8095132.1 hypothetical protein BDF21DRAFT_488740 [Thamnidium elegans]
MSTYSQWQPSSSYISQTHNHLMFFLVNDTHETISFDANECIAELEIIYFTDVEEIQSYQISKPDQDLHDFNYNDIYDKNNATADNLDDYEDYIKDMSEVGTVFTRNVRIDFGV